MPSFDIVCEPNAVELKNAVDTANKEIANRFDFKGSDARIELKEKENEVFVYADDDFKLNQVRDVLYGKMAKRNVDTRYLQSSLPRCPLCTQPQKAGTELRPSACSAANLCDARTTSGDRAGGSALNGSGGR